MTDAADDLWDRGYTVRPFIDGGPLSSLAKICRDSLPDEWHCDLPDYHHRVGSQEVHVKTVAEIAEKIQRTQHIEKLFSPETDLLGTLLGPDILIQNLPHLRVGRPNEDRDSIDLHRDSFYGSSIWHLNIWFPLIPLDPGSGLLIARGSHRRPSCNVRDATFTDEFRAKVEKGSVANKLGFVYRRRTDDSIESLRPSDLELIAPPLGCYVLFFGCMIHGGINRSAATRWTMDVRFSKLNDGSAVKAGYFRQFKRGLISKVADQFYQRESPDVTS